MRITRFFSSRKCDWNKAFASGINGKFPVEFPSKFELLIFVSVENETYDLANIVGEFHHLNFQ